MHGRGGFSLIELVIVVVIIGVIVWNFSTQLKTNYDIFITSSILMRLPIINDIFFKRKITFFRIVLIATRRIFTIHRTPRISFGKC